MRLGAARRAWAAAVRPRSLAARAPWHGGARAGMSTVPHWGALGRTEEEINEMAVKLRENYVKSVDAEASLHAYARQRWTHFDNPRYWLGDLNETLQEQMREHQAQLKQTFFAEHATLLDGIEDAYRAVVDEFTSEEPDFDRFVENGAMGEECAELLTDALQVWKNEGLRPVIDIDHVKTEIVSLTYAGMEVTVLITSREAHRTVPAASAAAAATAKTTAEAMPEATAEAKAEAKDEYREVSQLWHLTAGFTDSAHIIESLAKRRTRSVVLSDPEWKLMDINFTCFKMEVPPDPKPAAEVFAESMAQILFVGVVMAAIPYAIYRAVNPSKLQPLSTPLEQRKPLAKEWEGVQKTESNQETRDDAA